MKRRIKKEHTNLRFNILMIIVYIIGAILIVKLFELQIIKGSQYREISNTRLSRESTLEASRGEILDRSGNVLATSTSSFNIEMYKTKSDDETLNNCILNIIKLFEENEVSYPNNFPVNDECTAYTTEGDTLKKWLSKYKLAENTKPEDAVNFFVNKYNIKSNDIKEARKIISIRYEMTTKGYSSTKSLQLAENATSPINLDVNDLAVSRTVKEVLDTLCLFKQIQRDFISNQ